MRELSEIRMEIDRIDRQLVDLYEKRLTLTSQVAEYKRHTEKPVFDPVREKEKLDAIAAMAQTEQSAEQLRRLFTLIMEMSREQQKAILN